MKWNRRRALAGLSATATAALFRAPSADALGLAADKIKRIRYYAPPGDSLGGELRSASTREPSSTHHLLCDPASVLGGWRDRRPRSFAR